MRHEDMGFRVTMTPVENRIDGVIGYIRVDKEPACVPEETTMEKRTWEWDGFQLEETVDKATDIHTLRVATFPWGQSPIQLVGDCRAEVYERAVKAGCVEVALPVPCPMCGGGAKAIKEKGVVYTPHAVVCDGSAKCYIKGPSRESRNEAVAAWNDMAAMIRRGK